MNTSSREPPQPALTMQLIREAHARIRDKRGDQSSSAVADADIPALALASVSYGGNINFYHDHYANGPQIDARKIRSIYAAARAGGLLVGNPVGDALANVRDKEDVYAAYGQYQFGFGPLGIVTGLRVERTKAIYGGFKSDISNSLASAGVRFWMWAHLRSTSAL